MSSFISDIALVSMTYYLIKGLISSNNHNLKGALLGDRFLSALNTAAAHSDTAGLGQCHIFFIIKVPLQKQVEGRLVSDQLRQFDTIIKSFMNSFAHTDI